MGELGREWERREEEIQHPERAVPEETDPDRIDIQPVEEPVPAEPKKEPVPVGVPDDD